MADKNGSSGYYATQGLLLVVAFITAIVILFTDHNLQTDFGTEPKYFYHWYGMLVIAIVSLIGGIIIVMKHDPLFGKIGIAGSAIIAIFLVADIATYSTLNLGFTASQFATYLFGFAHYPGAGSYIPGLYDILFIEFILAVIVGVIALRKK